MIGINLVGIMSEYQAVEKKKVNPEFDRVIVRRLVRDLKMDNQATRWFSPEGLLVSCTYDRPDKISARARARLVS